MLRARAPISATAAAAIAAFAAAAQADIRVGVTTAVNPRAVGIPPGQEERVLIVGTDMQTDERVITGPSGRAHLLFVDGSNLSVGPDSDVVIDKFAYDPNTRTGELAFNVARGVFRFVGGRISKTSEVQFRTPAAVVGLRGGACNGEVPGHSGNPEKFHHQYGIMRVRSGGETRIAYRESVIEVPRIAAVGAPPPPPSNPRPPTPAETKTSLDHFKAAPVAPLADPAKAGQSPGPQPVAASGQSNPAPAPTGGEAAHTAAPDLGGGDLDSKAASLGEVNSAVPPAAPLAPPPAPPQGAVAVAQEAASKASEQSTATNTGPLSGPKKYLGPFRARPGT